jgi:hypothetical protein
MIYVSTVDIRGDLTGTMPITVFLAAFEPNLAVLCASIPMLRPCYTRYRQREATKHTGNSSSGVSGDTKDSHGSSGRKQRKNDVELDTIHILEHDVDYRSGNHNESIHTLDETGSDRKSTPAYPPPEMKKTKWTMLRA